MEKWERWDNKERMADEYELKCLIQDREGLTTMTTVMDGRYQSLLWRTVRRL